MDGYPFGISQVIPVGFSGDPLGIPLGSLGGLFRGQAFCSLALRSWWLRGPPDGGQQRPLWRLPGQICLLNALYIFDFINIVCGLHLFLLFAMFACKFVRRCGAYFFVLCLTLLNAV